MTPPRIMAITGAGALAGQYQPNGVLAGVVAGIGNSLTGSIGTDAIDPAAWVGDISRAALDRFDLKGGTVSHPLANIRDIISVQEDHSTGNVLILVGSYPGFQAAAPGNSSSSSSSSSSGSVPGFVDRTSLRGWVVKWDSSLGVASVFKPTEFGAEIALSGPMDCKLDNARRILWITECGRNDVLGVNADTGILVARYSEPTMTCPTVMAFSPTTGNVFVRAWDSVSGMEHIYEFSSTGFVAKFRGGSTPVETNVREGISSGTIAIPSVDSIRYDAVRDRLWWVSGPRGSMVYMVDVTTVGGRSLTVIPETPSSSSSSSS